MKVYLAAGWFSPMAEFEHNAIQEILQLENFDYFNPRGDNLVKPEEPEEARHHAFVVNLEEIKWCDLVLANTRDKDMGTIFECGYAYSISKPILYFWHQGEGDFNLMLAQSGIAVAKTYLQLRDCLLNFRIDPSYRVDYKGRIA